MNHRDLPRMLDVQGLGRLPWPPTALLQDPSAPPGKRWLAYGPPRQVLSTQELAHIPGLLRELETLVESSRLEALGYLSYEAAPAFEPRLRTHPAGELPLTWWALFDQPHRVDHHELPDLTPARLHWQPSLGPVAYHRAIEAIRASIAQGDTYQANFTFPWRCNMVGEPLSLFLALARAQPSSLAAYLDLGRFAICSASPELFFRREGTELEARPMKGTARRGRTLEEDQRAAAGLACSRKERAENVMIVDMLRNDLGRVAEVGSVRAGPLFQVETYPTVHQLVSTVRARSEVGLADLLAAIFPCASITGAPKVRTMEILHQLEREPRGIYTGAIGWLGPGRKARFNVAIRTALVDRHKGTATYGTGGGILWDSDPERELQECHTKALVLGAAPEPAFSLFETLRWRPRSGFFLLERHLQRMADSATYFRFPFSLDTARTELEKAAGNFSARQQRVRMVLEPDGNIKVESRALSCSGRVRWTLALDGVPTDESNPFLFHKTTRRELYEQAQARHPEADEVVLWNRRGELMESTRANLVLKLDGRLLTPPWTSGLLPGTYRAELLERGRIHEQVLHLEDLHRAEATFLVNSLRGWIRATLLSTHDSRSLTRASP